MLQFQVQCLSAISGQGASAQAPPVLAVGRADPLVKGAVDELPPLDVEQVGGGEVGFQEQSGAGEPEQAERG